MDYKVEVIVEKRIIHSKIYPAYSHPNQVVRKAIKAVGTNNDYMQILVVNGFGEVWSYVAEKKGSSYKAWPTGNTVTSKNEVLMAFSGNKSIAELL